MDGVNGEGDNIPNIHIKRGKPIFPFINDFQKVSSSLKGLKITSGLKDSKNIRGS